MWTKDRTWYRLNHQYELLEVLTGRKRRNLRQQMRRRGYGNTVDEFARFIAEVVFDPKKQKKYDRGEQNKPQKL